MAVGFTEINGKQSSVGPKPRASQSALCAAGDLPAGGTGWGKAVGTGAGQGREINLQGSDGQPLPRLDVASHSSSPVVGHHPLTIRLYGEVNSTL